MNINCYLDTALEWRGVKNTNCSPVARLLDLPNCDCAHIGHLRSHNALNLKDWIDLATAMSVRFHPMQKLPDRGIGETLEEVINKAWLGTGCQYLSFNFNVIDASDLHSFTSTEPGSLETVGMMEIVSSLGRCSVVPVINISEYCTSLRLVAMARAWGKEQMQS